MTEAELVETLAHYEHASWARWQAYLHSLCTRRKDGALVIPKARVLHWEEEIKKSYAELPEHIKQYDRDEVAHILPIIQRYVGEIADGAFQYVNRAIALRSMPLSAEAAATLERMLGDPATPAHEGADLPAVSAEELFERITCCPCREYEGSDESPDQRCDCRCHRM